MSLIELIIELMFDAAAIVLGVILIFATNDNQHRFYWGVIATLIGSFLLWENSSWIFTVMKNPGYEYLEVLNIEKMLKTFFIATIISLFPLASLRPGYLNRKRIVIYLLPFITLLTIATCYLSSDGIITKIASASEIIPNLNKFDVRFRLLIFLFSVLIPLFYFFYPIVRNITYRKASPNMYLFLGFIFLLLSLYTFFTLSINAFFFNGLGITSIIFAITFSILYLRSENPLSIHTGNMDKDIESTQKVIPLFYEIDNHLKEHHPFIDSNYLIKDLAQTLEIYEDAISDAIKSAGFTGFREYINFRRLEYFKVLASQNSQTTVKELMFACGFTSRTTFYRVFSEQYGMSPIKYINNQIDR